MKNLRLVMTVAALACASGPAAPDGGEIAGGEPFRLGVGEEARLASQDLTVRFVAVTADSRCPTDVNCFWAGDAELELNVAQGDEETSVSLHTHGGADYPREAEAFGCTLRLQDVEPQPRSTVKIAPEDYVAVLEVTLEE